ncbi:APG9-domain-containing protein [Neoconidiobolus thromboides FSU 785]|nr:APG9-domain-containing protein [Neoconidiobolus thromboides FSU 785]
MNTYESNIDQHLKPGKKTKKRTNRKERIKNVTEPYQFNWEKVGNLDQYLRNVYYYYEGKGIHCIVLSEILNLLSMVFVVSFLTFTGGCLNYDKFKPGNSLNDAIAEKCLHELPALAKLGLIFFGFIIVGYLAKIIYETRDLLEMYHFYTKVLGIPNEDMQSVDWKEVTKRINRLDAPSSDLVITTANLGAAKLDAYKISHLILRKENYLIALYNLNKLKLGIQFPRMLGGWFYPIALTKGLEWNISFCIDTTFFDSRGKLNRGILNREEKKIWASKLNRKFKLMGLINLIFGPVIVIYTVCFFVFRYFEEYYKNPKALGIRQYTLLSQWKFREFNELPHHFRNRIDNSYPIAVEYLNHFPKEKTDKLMKFITFIAGTLAGAFAVLAIFDSEAVLQFEIIGGRSVLACTAILGMVLAITRPPVAEKAKIINAESHLAMLLEYLHYMPKAWHDKLHSEKVRQEFASMFTLQVVQLIHEIFGLFITPYILLFSLPDSSFDIVDLFRECSSKESGLGYVCSFASFNLQKHGDKKSGVPSTLDNNTLNRKYTSKDGKLEKSIITFKGHNPDWFPEDPTSSLFLNKVKDFTTYSIKEGETNELMSSKQDIGHTTDANNVVNEDLLHSFYTRSSQMEEPMNSNPFNRGMMMRALSLVINIFIVKIVDLIFFRCLSLIKIYDV